MAGAKLTIEADTKKAQAALQGAAATLDGEGLNLLLSDIGEYLRGATQERAGTEQSPEGEPWAALSPRYAARKKKKRPGAGILSFDHHMLGDRLSWQVSGDTLYVGTSAKYGAIHQFGGRGIPARPWLGVSDTDAEEITALVHNHLAAALNRESP